jgi:MEMO1 family protein
VTRRDASAVRPAAVAGTFYPADATVLREAVDDALAAAPRGGPAPKAIIAPHAGYRYSGPVAASAYARLLPARGTVERVVLVGPAHRVPVASMAVPSVDALATPLGQVRVDDAARRRALRLDTVVTDDRAHAGEHSLEVQLPFLMAVLGPDISVLPVVVGHATDDEVATLLEELWGGPETVVVVSSDLSHYEDYRSAARHDRVTADAILARHGERIGPYDACGALPVRGLLHMATRHGLDVELLDLRSSGDTVGDPSRVVGYGAFALR